MAKFLGFVPWFRWMEGTEPLDPGSPVTDAARALAAALLVRRHCNSSLNRLAARKFAVPISPYPYI